MWITCIKAQQPKLMSHVIEHDVASRVGVKKMKISFSLQSLTRVLTGGEKVRSNNTPYNRAKCNMARPYVSLSDLELNQAHPNLSHHDPDGSDSFNHLITNKASNKTRYFGINFGLFSKTFLRCIATTVFIALLLITFSVYEKKGNFSQNQKYTFQAVITAESLFLGLNFFVSHNFRCAKEPTY